MHRRHSKKLAERTLWSCRPKLTTLFGTYAACPSRPAPQLFSEVNVAQLEEGAKALVKEVKALPKEIKEQGGWQEQFGGRL